MSDEAEAKATPAVRATQYGLLIAGQLSWLFAWSAALGSWLGGDRLPVLAPYSLLLLLTGGAALVRPALAVKRAPRLAGLALALLGVLVTGFVGLETLFAVGGWWDWAKASDLLEGTAWGTRAIAAGALALITWWRGIATGRESPALWRVEDEFRLGIIALGGLLAIVAITGSTGRLDAGLLVYPTLGFVFVNLVGMPLAQIVDESGSTRHGGATGLAPGGRWLAMLLGVVGLLLMVTLLVAQVLTFERIAALLEPLREPLGAAFWFLFYVLVVPIGYLVQFLIYLARLVIKPGEPAPPPQFPQTNWVDELRRQERPEVASPELLIALKVVGLLVACALVIALLARAVFRLRGFWREDDVEELREIEWSWPGLRAALLWIFGRLWPRRIGGLAALFHAAPVGRVASLGIRELYRQFLALGTSIGWARRNAETPLEYERRLGSEGDLEGEPEIRALTESYVRIRYGRPSAVSPDSGRAAEALARLRALWAGRESRVSR